MYLSRLILNPRSRAVRNDLSDCRGLHRTILSAFPQAIKDQGGARAEFGVLFRADAEPRSGRITLLVQSQTEPDWSRLPQDYLLDDADELDNPAVKQVDDKYNALSKGLRLRFRLRANPTRRLPLLIENRVGKERGKRVEIFREEEQLAWLRRKGEQHGFRLLAARVNPNVLNARANPEGKVIGWRERSQPPMKFGSVLFEGELEIADAEKFRQTLAQGIGSGKAYGFGLLSIAPLHQ
ncbi:MAG TPA: type I-E CRISPR-associated protein Cas6/Cse3/CasE [Blastocatellia bacterium]|nr:type I-E CRISPR-associated protein Cas6/Cse3/CasE [Blastocatellia bacterium]